MGKLIKQVAVFFLQKSDVTFLYLFAFTSALEAESKPTLCETNLC